MFSFPNYNLLLIMLLTHFCPQKHIGIFLHCFQTILPAKVGCMRIYKLWRCQYQYHKSPVDRQLSWLGNDKLLCFLTTFWTELDALWRESGCIFINGGSTGLQRKKFFFLLSGLPALVASRLRLTSHSDTFIDKLKTGLFLCALYTEIKPELMAQLKKKA